MKLVVIFLFIISVFSLAIASEERNYLDSLTNPTRADAPNTVSPCADMCTEYNLSTICQARVFANVSRTASDYQNKFKNHDELKNYFYTYRQACKDDAHDNYINQYEDYIARASENFGVPEVLLSCLLFKENQFLSKRKSASRATGIAQFIPIAITHISNIIGSNTKDSTLNKYQAIVYSYSEENALKLTRTQRVQLYKDYEFSRRVIKNHTLLQNWKSYIDSIKTSDTFKKHYAAPPWKGEYPTIFNTQRADTPPLAIGASALYLKDIITQMTFGRKNALSSDSRDELLDFLTAIGGAYNMGPGNAGLTIGTPPPSSAKEWVRKMRDNNRQTKAHIDSIRNCMEKNNLNPPKLTTGKDQNKCPN